MKYFVATSAVVGAASAVAFPRAIQQPCMQLESNNVPVPDPHTPEAFYSYPYYSNASSTSTAPSGFEMVFSNRKAAILLESDKYMQFVNLDNYDVALCSAACDATSGCDAFNIYFMRYPDIEPADACPNPKANTVVRCSLYSAPVEASEAQNMGQIRGPVDSNGQAFQVLIAGSNAYNRISASASSSSSATTITVTQTQTDTSVAPSSTLTVTQNTATTTVTLSASSETTVSTDWPHTSTASTTTESTTVESTTTASTTVESTTIVSTTIVSTTTVSTAAALPRSA